MFKRIITVVSIVVAVSTGAAAQTIKDFKDAIDSLQTRLPERTKVSAQVKAKKVVRRG